MNEQDLFDNLLAKKFAPEPKAKITPGPAPVVSGIPEPPLPEPVRVDAEPPAAPSETPEQIRTRQKVDIDYQRAKKDALEKALVMVETRFPGITPDDSMYHQRVRSYRNVVMQQGGFERPVEDEAPPPPAQPKPMSGTEAIRKQRERGDKTDLTPVEYAQSPVDLPERTAEMLEAQRAEMGGGPMGRVLPPVPEGVDPKEFEKAFEERFTKARKRGQDSDPALDAPADPFARISASQRSMMTPPKGKTPTLVDFEQLEKKRQEGIETPFGRRYVAPGPDGDFLTTPGVGEVASRTFQSWAGAWGSLFTGDFKGWAIGNTAYMSEAVIGLWEMATGAEGAGSEEANRYVSEAIASSEAAVRDMASGKGARDLSGFLKANEGNTGTRMAEAVMDGLREMTVTTRGSGALVTSGAISAMNLVGLDGAKILDPDLMIQSALSANYNQQFLGYTAESQDSIAEHGYISDLLVEAAREAPQTIFELAIAFATGGSSVVVQGGSRKMTAAAVKKAIKRQAKLRAAGAAVTSAQEVAGRAMVDGYEYWTDLGYTTDQALAQAQIEAITAYAVTASTEYVAGKIILEKIPGLGKHITHAAARIARKGVIAAVTGGVQEVGEEVIADALISYSRDEESMLDQLIEGDPDTWYQISLIAGVGALMDGTAGAIAGVAEPKPTKEEVLKAIGEISLNAKKKRAENHQLAIEFVDNVEASVFDNLTDQELAKVASSKTDSESGVGDETAPEIAITETGIDGTSYVERVLSPAEARIILMRRHGMSLEEADLQSLQQVEPAKAPVVSQTLGEKPAVTDKRQLREDARGTLGADVAFAGGDPLANMELREWVLDNPELAQSIAEASSPPSRSEMETLFNRKHKSNSGANRARFWAATQVAIKSLPEPGVTQEAQAEAAPVATETAPQDSAGTLVEIGVEKQITEQESTKATEAETEPIVAKQPADPIEPEAGDTEATEFAEEVKEKAAENAPAPDKSSLRQNLLQNVQSTYRSVLKVAQSAQSEKSHARKLREAIFGASPADGSQPVEELDLTDRSILDKLEQLVPGVADVVIDIMSIPGSEQANLLSPDKQRRYKRHGVTLAGLDALSDEDLHLLGSALTLMQTEGVDVNLTTEATTAEQEEARDYAAERGVRVLFFSGGKQTLSGEQSYPSVVAVSAEVSDRNTMQKILLHELVHTWQKEADAGDVTRLFKALASIAPEATMRMLERYSKGLARSNAIRKSQGMPELEMDDFRVAMELPALVAESILEFIGADEAVINELLRTEPGAFLRFIQKLLEVLKLRKSLEQRLGKKQFDLLERLSKQADNDFSVRQKVEAAKTLKNIFADLKQTERLSFYGPNNVNRTSFKPAEDLPVLRKMEPALVRYTREKLPKSGRLALEEFTRTFRSNSPSLSQEADWRNWDSFVAEITARRTDDNNGTTPKKVTATAAELEAFFNASSPVIRQYVGTKSSSELAAGNIDDSLYLGSISVTTDNDKFWQREPSALAQMLAGKYVSWIISSEYVERSLSNKGILHAVQRTFPGATNYELRVSSSIKAPQFRLTFDRTRDAVFNYGLQHVFEVRVPDDSDSGFSEYEELPINQDGNLSYSEQYDPLSIEALVDLLGPNMVVLQPDPDTQSEIFNEYGSAVTLGELALEKMRNTEYQDAGTNTPLLVRINLSSAGADFIPQFGPKQDRDMVDLTLSAKDSGITILAKDTYKATTEVDLKRNMFYGGIGSNTRSLDSNESPLRVLQSAFSADDTFGTNVIPTNYAEHWFASNTQPPTANPRDYAEVTFVTAGIGSLGFYQAQHFNKYKTSDVAGLERSLVQTDLDLKFPVEVPGVNLAGHMRYDIRTDPDGNTVMFVGEIQSDYQVDSMLYGVQPRKVDGNVRAALVDKKKVRVTHEDNGVQFVNLENGKTFSLRPDEAKLIQDYIEPDESSRENDFGITFGYTLIDFVIGENEGKTLPVSSSNEVANVLDQLVWVLGKELVSTREAQGRQLPKGAMRPVGQLPLLDAEHHARGITDLIGKQLIKIAVQKGVDRIAFAHGETLDEQWSYPIAPQPVAYEYNPDTEVLTFAFYEGNPADESSLDKIETDAVKSLQEAKREGKLKRGLISGKTEDAFLTPKWGDPNNKSGSIVVPRTEDGKVNRAQIARAFANRNATLGLEKGHGNTVSDLFISEIANSLNSADSGPTSGVAMAKPVVTSKGRKLYTHSNLKGPQNKRLSLMHKFMQKNGYGTRLAQGSTDHGLLDSVFDSSKGAPLDIYTVDEQAVKDVEDSNSGAYTVNFSPAPTNEDGQSYDEVSEEGQFPENLPDTTAAKDLRSTVGRLLATDTSDKSDYPDTFFVGENPEDLKGRNNWLNNILFTATNSTNALVKEIAVKMVYAEMRNRRYELEQDDADSRYYDSLPKEFRADNGALFFELMDKVKVAPEDVDTHPKTKDLPAPVRRTLAHFKARGEDMRRSLLQTKRDVIIRSSTYGTMQDIVDQANDLLPKGETPWQLKRLPRRSDPSKTRTYIIDSEGNRLLKDDADNTAGRALAELAYTDDWGYQYEHIHHAFFGSYDVGYLDMVKYEKARLQGVSHHQAQYIALVRQGAADSQADAAQQMLDIRKDNQKNDDALKDKDGNVILVALPSVQVPSDVAVRLSSRQHAALLNELREAGGLTSQEIFDATRGIVGTKGAKNPFYAAMMERTGAKGYSTDFWRVWQLQRRGFRRYMLAQDIRKIVFPRTEALRKQGLYKWADTYENLADYIIYPASDRNVGPVEKWFDSSLEGIFGGTGDRPNALFRALRTDRALGHRPLRRFAHKLRTFHYLTKLKTVRQHFINSFQIMQTVWPLVGELGMLRAVRLYNSKEGRRILKKYGPSPDASMYQDAPMGGGIASTRAVRSLQRVGRKVLNGVPYEVRSEVRNQNFSFLAMYDHAVRNLGMSEQQAAEFAMVRGVVMTQYAFTRTTQPVFLRSPIGATAFQFKRFLINQVQLAYAMYHRGMQKDVYATTGYGAFTRFATMQFLLGGLRGLVPLALYEIGKAGFCKAFPEQCARYGTPTGRDDVEEVRAWLEDATGSRGVANSVAHGVFAGLLDVDVSGSVALFDRPYGRNFGEVLGNQFLGPAGTSAIRLATDLTEKTTVPMGTTERIFKSVLDTSPALNPIRFMPDAWNSMADYLDATQEMEASGRPYFNSQGEFQFDMTVGVQFRKMCGFRTMTETEVAGQWAHQQAVAALIDGTLDEMATYIAIKDKETAKEIRDFHNAMYPELKVVYAQALRRAQNKKEARKQPVSERRLDNASKGVQRYMNRKYGESER